MAVLIDITKCIGCESCSVACKLYNSLDFKSEPRNIKNGKLRFDKVWHHWLNLTIIDGQ